MKPLYLPAIGVVCLLTSVLTAYAQDTIPNQVFGTYVTAHTTCFVGPRNAKGEKTWTDCSNSTDTLKIEQNPDTNTQRELPAIVSIDLAFTNGHACSFKGVAGWSVDRLTAYSGEQPNCQIIMFFFARAAHLVATKECSAHCGARGSLDGVVLKKQSGL